MGRGLSVDRQGVGDIGGDRKGWPAHPLPPLEGEEGLVVLPFLPAPAPTSQPLLWDACSARPVEGGHMGSEGTLLIDTQHC